MYSFILALGEKFREKNKTWWQSGYAIAILAVAIATIIRLLLNSIFGVKSPFLVYFAAVMFSSLYGGRQGGILATMLSALASNYLFLNPTHALQADSFEQMVRLGIFISEGLLISHIVSKLQSTTQRLQLSQETLSESEEFYRLLVDVVQDYAIFMLDPDGFVVSWNKGAERLKGHRSDEIIGHHFSRFYPQEDVEQGILESALKTAATTDRVETEGWHIRKDGSRFWANVLLTTLRDDAGNLKGFSNVTRDVTAIREYEAERDRLITELQLERSRLETILEQMPVGVVMAEAVTGKLIFGNQEMEKILRHSFIPAENIEQYQKYKTFHPDGRLYQPQETVLARTITRGEVVKDEEIYIQRGDGTCGTILANSTPLYNGQGEIEAGVVAFLDITERKQAQEQLANLNTILERRVQERTAQLEQAKNEAQLTLNLLNGIIEGTNDIIGALNLEFRFTAFNSAYKQEFTKVFGREPELGMSILDAVAHLPIEQAKVREIWGRALQGDNYTIIEDFGDPNLERNYYEINFNEIKDANNQLIGASQIVRNVSDRIRTEAQIHNLNQELEQKVTERTQALEAEIQERIKIEANLRESEEKFRATFDQVAVGIAHANLDGKYLLVNQKLCDILGYSQTELMNLSIADITYAEDIATDLENTRRMVANEIKSFSMEKRYIRKDGSIVWGNLTVSVVREANGEPKYLLRVLEDISDRKRFEENLATKNREITNILNSITDGFVSIDKDWRYTYVNSKAEEILGKQKSDLLGNNVWEVFPQAVSLPGYRYCYQVVHEQITIKYEEFNPFLNKWLDVRLYPSADALTVYFQDISEHKQAEIALRLSESKFMRLADANVVGIIVANYTGKIVEANDAFLQMLGYTKSDLDAGEVNWRSISPSEYLPLDEQKWQKLQQTGKVSFEKEYLHKNGDRIPVLIAAAKLEGNEEAAICMIVDLTERQQAENALRQSEQSFRNLADSMPQIVWTANPDGTVDYYNQRVYEFSGFSQQADGTWEWQPVLYPDDEQRTVEAWQQAVETGEIYECEHRIKRVNGEFRWYLSRGIPVKDEQGCVIKWYGTATDIHAQKQYQAEREQLLRREQTARTEAESASRLKDEFLATLSHELRTPMNAMLGWTTMLRTRKLNETTTARALETIERNTKTLNQLIEDILDVSRIIRGKVRFSLQPLELLPVFEQAIETIKPTATVKDIQIVLEPLQANSLKVMGDSSRLQQIIWNLLSNAIKFTPNGGCVTIRLSAVMGKEGEKLDDRGQGLGDREELPQPLTPSFGETAEPEKYCSCPIFNCRFAQIQITDTGIGINSEFLPFVFDRFRQADGSITRSHGGLGLGLAIVRHLVELHGGTVEVFSLGAAQGSTFTVKLPLVVESSSAQEQAGRGEGSFPLSSDALLKDLRVLVVDDESDARDLISVILEDRGAKVTAVGSAQEAFTTVLQKSPLDIIVSDIGMPEGDGYSLIRQIRQLPPEAGGKIPAIALTAYASAEDSNKAISAGFNRHIRKPVDPTELTMAIAHIVDRHPSTQKESFEF
ncbi:PAS domain S-box protein [Phormidium sp. LEGE 05292]|uniref:PAS domain S-box protein n=1 Tax=[Phormidium] sp. LEGE 05292 TaxID=767427 RepID=UPI00187F2785|nr:PAS domain S-box protein [Phormidium sp. LEGE 05292]MBE9227968.1 PAS domain S-box protein [Phormidium sp. LEGE 05292]